MPSLDQNDDESAVYHDCVETDESPIDTAAADAASPNHDTSADDVESCPLNNRSDSADGSTNSYPSHQRSEFSTTESESGASGGSSVAEAVFNFTNSIVGAGCIGLGGAIALSGGFISIGLVLFFALLTKLSLDLLIRLSLEYQSPAPSSHSQHSQQHDKICYEDVAQLGMGWAGRIIVMLCKFSYAFGCLVAYVIVIKDNCGPALKSLIYGREEPSFFTERFLSRLNNWFYCLLSKNAWFTWAISLCLILPLCMLRDMTPLAFTSLVSVASMIMIVVIVIYIYFDCPEVREPGGTYYENWVEIRPG
ncbi:MAG: hypothetical protein SGILL_000651, partial [Bacillariaceae sp.]